MQLQNNLLRLHQPVRHHTAAAVEPQTPALTAPLMAVLAAAVLAGSKNGPATTASPGQRDQQH
jgi:hypothetical protein